MDKKKTRNQNKEKEGKILEKTMNRERRIQNIENEKVNKNKKKLKY